MSDGVTGSEGGGGRSIRVGVVMISETFCCVGIVVLEGIRWGRAEQRRANESDVRFEQSRCDPRAAELVDFLSIIRGADKIND
jgi:hypothetical protein